MQSERTASANGHGESLPPRLRAKQESLRAKCRHQDVVIDVGTRAA